MLAKSCYILSVSLFVVIHLCIILFYFFSYYSVNKVGYKMCAMINIVQVAEYTCIIMTRTCLNDTNFCTNCCIYNVM